MVVGWEKWISRSLLPFRAGKSIYQILSLLLVQVELSANGLRVAAVETVLGELLLLRQTNFPVGLVRGPAQVVHARGILEKRANALQSVCQLYRDRVEINPAALLEVGELRDFQPIQQDLPADAPRAKRRRLPVIFLKANIVLFQRNANGAEALQVKILHVGRGRLQDDLKLRVLIQPVGVLAVSPVGGPTAGLHVSHAIRSRTQHAQKCFRMHRAGANLHIIGLLQHAALLHPEV